MMISPVLIRLSRTLMFLLTASLLMTGCRKEYSQETTTPYNPTPSPSDGMAVYALVQQGSSCSDATVSGSYKTGTPTGDDAKIQITVNVTTPGIWAMSTGTVNGLRFTGSGNFTNTGRQRITLQASGIPVQAGVFTFPIQAYTSTCSVALTVTGDSPVPTSEYYYKMTVNGKDYTQEATDNNNYMATAEVIGDVDVLLGAGITWNANIPLPAGKTELVISKGIYKNYRTTSQQDFKNFFKPGDYTYATINGQVYTDGIIINWTDENGKTWDSFNGTTGQPGGTFTIISTEEVPNMIDYYVKVKMRFSCKLYNHATGDVINVTNGEMVSSFIKK
ncbi:hypothetical protein [Chitinophaga flava]|uniref:DUF1735 domain-containing protein n=1 Tax=Chitinophaga flava TaxID=2259036 RepID=A0A365XP32_9BACT|nr:hypothetical protein [Chitinophaga flava]RBL88092.1 hypothetical protein DF182_31695 [Chitinophaga flava]